MKSLFHLCVFVFAFAQAGFAQNLLVNGGFEDIPAANLGNNIDSEISPWQSGRFIPAGLKKIKVLGHDLIAVDGAGGPNIVNNLYPQADATAVGAMQHYIDPTGLDLWSGGPHYHTVWQYFTPTCNGSVTASGSFASAFSFSSGAISVFPVSGVEVTTSGMAAGTVIQNANTDQLWAQIDSNAANLNLQGGSGGQNWENLSQTYPVVAGQRYGFAVMGSQHAFFDNASATLDCNPAVPVITPQDVTLFKSCQPPEPHTHNGILGQRWTCQVDVSAATAPFLGDIIIHDVFTNSALVNGQTLLGQSTSGNGSCFQGDCMISGSNFDTSGTESFTFDIFVEATGEADVYPLENCVTGEIDEGAGAMQPLTPHCTSGQWVPRTDVVKTCDPLPANATAPYTMNCSIEVSASGLVGGTYVSVMDAFAARPPSIATVTPTFMNVTSNENWDCIDHALNTPSSIGICELPAEDLMAAGGTSTLEISFQFDVDQAPTQVANCRFTDIHSGSYLDKLSGQRSAQRSPIQNGATQASGWPQMPDGCVFVDVPGPQLETKVETKITKDCDQPHLTNLNGTWGYLWQCEAEVEVTPSPFAGTVSFTDDGSQISMGTAEFVSVSAPNNCQGLGTDTLNCTYQGATFSSPHAVQYDLFTPYVATDEEIEWKNCIRGEAETAAGTFPSVPMCTGRTIKPTDVPVLPPVKEIKLEKVCEDAGREMTYDGQTGLGWDCKIIVTATPAPFAGSFTFTEDASAITGSNGQIIAIDQPQPANWTCAPSVPTASTDCTIAGATFDAGGVEAVGFTLFAPNEGEVIDWKNCVSGVYSPNETGGGDVEPFDVKGNCESITWKPPVVSTPATFSIKKSCRGPFDQGIDGQSYSCTINITQTGGDPITQPLTMTELFSSLTTGQSATQFMIGLQGTTGWTCDMPTASCSIQPAAFNGATGHQIGAFFLIPNGVLAEQDFENCAALSMSGATVAASDCVTLDEPSGDPEFEVNKDCKPTGERMVMGASGWFQPWACTITVTSNGVPFSGPLWINDDMVYGPHNGSQSVISITSADPWQCTPAPYGPGANQPACAIQGNQFPHTTSTLNVTLNLFGSSAEQFGAENCASVSMGAAPSSNPADVLGEGCFEFVATPDPKEPHIDLVKTCEAATQSAGGQWTVNCTLTITGQNLPNGHQFRVTDELMSSSTQTALFGNLTAPVNSCSGAPIAGGAMSGCDLTTDMINANGGTLTIPFTGTYQGPAGRPMNGPRAQNCGYVDVASLGLHGPQGGNGKSCVPIEFKASIGSGVSDVVIDPATPDVGGPVVTDPPFDLSSGITVTPMVPTGPPELGIDKSCNAATALAGNIWSIDCTLTLSVRNLPQGEFVKVQDHLREVPGMVVQSSTWSAAGVTCSSQNLGANCFIPTGNFGPHAFGPLGETVTIPYSATMFVANTNAVPTLNTENCTRTTMFANGQWTESPQSVNQPFQMLCVPITFDMSTVVDPVGGPLTGDVQDCSIDTLFVVDRSGSMGGQRMFETKQALETALTVFEGNGSRSGLVLFQSSAWVAGTASDVLPSQALNSEIVALSAGGGTNWEAGLQTANQAISAMADKPLVLFVTDGQPTVGNNPALTPTNGSHGPFIAAATPYLNAIRAQGSRVVGINIGNGGLTNNLAQLLGPNVATVSASGAIDPRVNDVVEIPHISLILPAFEQIARAYCPEYPGVSEKSKKALTKRLALMPKSAFVYQGDDELPSVTTSDPAAPGTAPQSVFDTVLKTRKQQTSECIVNRNTQRYTCGFRITVTNEGNAPFNGPLVVTDTFGSPWAQAVTQTSDGGWSCAQPVGGAVSCEHSGLNLPQGSFAYIDLDMQVQGLVNGGDWENCAATGIPNDRKQRVAAIQQVMNARGLAAGPVDGLPGAKTYRALAELQKSLGLPVSRNFDDALFRALGLPLAKPGEKACVIADLPPMPKPPLVCERATAIKKGETCACRYGNMVKRNATACSCKSGYSFVAGEGCVIKAKPAPTPPPQLEETLTCDKRSTRLRGDQCVCIDHENAVKTSQTSCRCKNGGPMINGRCLSITITPGSGKPSETDDAVGTQEPKKCKIEINGICIK